MSPSRRERDYERRRHEEWQARKATRGAARARRRARAAAAGSAVAVLLAVGGIAWGTGAFDGEDDAAPAASTATASPTDGATTEDATAAADAPGEPCPEPTSTPPAEPASFPEAPDPATAEGRTWTAVLTTSCGEITAELDGAAAPQAVASFVFLAEQGFYAGTPCHRLTTAGISVLQCGDPTGTGQGGPGYAYGPVENAPEDDVYPAGTIAMARVGGDASSMGSQFFLVYEDSTIPSDQAGGYTVLGRITSGLDVVQRVAAGGAEGGTDGAPVQPISIESVSVA